jgi:hypothetical protein
MMPTNTRGYVKLALGVFLALSLSSGNAGDFATIGTARSEITIDKTHTEECGEYVNFVEKFTRFTLFKYDWQQKKHYLIRQDFELGQGCFEGYNPAQVTVTANALDPIKGTVGTRTEWQFSAAGASGDVAGYPFQGLYKVTLPGCCAASAVDKYFSLITGNFIMASTIRPLLLDLAEQRSQRYIAAEANTAAERWNNAKNIATLFLGNPKSNLQRVYVNSSDTKLSSEDWDVAQLNFAGAKVKNGGGDPTADNQTHTLFKSSEIAGLSIQMVLRCRCDSPEIHISLPLQLERFDIEHATVRGIDSVSLGYPLLPPTSAYPVIP